MLTPNDDLDTESNQGCHEIYISDCEAEIMQSEQATSSCSVLMPHHIPVLTPINIPNEPTSPSNNMLKEAEDSYILTEVAVLKAQVDGYDKLLPYKVKNVEANIDIAVKEIGGLRYYLELIEKQLDELRRVVFFSTKEITELKATVQKMSIATTSSTSASSLDAAPSVATITKPELITPVATITPSNYSGRTSLASTPILSPEMIPVSTVEIRKALLEVNKELLFLHNSCHQSSSQPTEALDEHINNQLQSMEEDKASSRPAP